MRMYKYKKIRQIKNLFYDSHLTDFYYLTIQKDGFTDKENFLSTLFLPGTLESKVPFPLFHLMNIITRSVFHIWVLNTL